VALLRRLWSGRGRWAEGASAGICVPGRRGQRLGDDPHSRFVL